MKRTIPLSGEVSGVEQEVIIGDAPSLRESQKSRLDDLLARVEAATGADRELDCDLFVATAESPFVNYYPDCVLAVLGGFRARVEINEVATYTSSIDAALALVERMIPGAIWTVKHLGEGEYAADVGSSDFNEPMYGSEVVKTPTLAILSALLRALSDERDGSIGRG